MIVALQVIFTVLLLGFLSVTLCSLFSGKWKTSGIAKLTNNSKAAVFTCMLVECFLIGFF